MSHPKIAHHLVGKLGGCKLAGAQGWHGQNLNNIEPKNLLFSGTALMSESTSSQGRPV